MPPFDESWIARRTLFGACLGTAPAWTLIGFAWVWMHVTAHSRWTFIGLLAALLFETVLLVAAGICAAVPSIFVAGFVEYWSERVGADQQASSRVALVMGFATGTPAGLFTAWGTFSAIGYIGP